MRCTMLQLASGEPYETMMDLTKDWHHAYCERHKWDFSPRKQFVHYSPFNAGSMVEMFMADALYEYADGDICAFMPCDAIITKPAIDLREALPRGFDFAMFGNRSFVNSGFAVVRNNKNVRDFFTASIRKGPVGQNDDVSVRMSLEIKESQTVECCYLGSKWQWYESFGAAPLTTDCPESDAIIRAWHGGSRYHALREMKVTLVGLKEGAI